MSTAGASAFGRNAQAMTDGTTVLVIAELEQHPNHIIAAHAACIRKLLKAEERASKRKRSATASGGEH